MQLTDLIDAFASLKGHSGQPGQAGRQAESLPSGYRQALEIFTSSIPLVTLEDLDMAFTLEVALKLPGGEVSRLSIPLNHPEAETAVAEKSTLAIVKAFRDDQVDRGLSRSTIESYNSLLTAFATFAPEWPPTVEKVRAFLRGHRERGLSLVTIDDYWRWLNTWFEWARRRGYLSFNPILQVSRPEHVEVEADVIPPQDFVQVINVLREIIAHTRPRQHSLPYERAVRDLAIIRFAYATSCRINEIAGLQLRDLHLAERKAIIRPHTTKSKKKREVYFGRQAQRALEMWFEIRPYDAGDWVFTGTRGNGWTRNKRFTRSGMYLAWRRRQRAAGVGPYEFHEIRHSHITHSMNNGIPLHHVSRQAGHSSTEITARVYVHSQDPDRQRAYDDRNPDDMLEEE